MSQSIIDARTLQRELRGRMLRSVGPAIKRLARAARGDAEFGNDHELRACIALARLAPALLFANAADTAAPRSLIHPSLSAEDAERLIREMLESHKQNQEME